MEHSVYRKREFVAAFVAALLVNVVFRVFVLAGNLHEVLAAVASMHALLIYAAAIVLFVLCFILFFGLLHAGPLLRRRRPSGECILPYSALGLLPVVLFWRAYI